MRHASVSGWEALASQISFRKNALIHSSASGGAGGMAGLMGVALGLQWLHLSPEHSHGLMRISGEPVSVTNVAASPVPLLPGSCFSSGERMLDRWLWCRACITAFTLGGAHPELTLRLSLQLLLLLDGHFWTGQCSVVTWTVNPPCYTSFAGEVGLLLNCCTLWDYGQWRIMVHFNSGSAWDPEITRQPSQATGTFVSVR